MPTGRPAAGAVVVAGAGAAAGAAAAAAAAAAAGAGAAAAVGAVGTRSDEAHKRGADRATENMYSPMYKSLRIQR